MSEEWQRWLEQETSNVDVLEKRIEDLSSNHNDPAGFRYREFWAEADAISDMFKTLIPLPEEDKERLWTRYSRICGETKKRQEQEGRIRRAQSKQKRGLIERKIQEACSYVDSAPDDIKSLSKAQSLLNEALGWLRDGEEDADATDEPAETRSGSEVGLLGEDRQACWEKWRKINETVFSRREALWELNYNQIEPQARAALEEANDGDPFHALDKVKEAQNRLREMPLSNFQRENVRSSLNSAWEIAISKITEIREEKKRRHEEWLNRMTGNIERWTEIIRKNKDESSELRAQIDRIRGEIRKASSKEHADTLRDWIAGKRQKVKEIHGMNSELEERIRDVKEKLGS